MLRLSEEFRLFGPGGGTVGVVGIMLTQFCRVRATAARDRDPHGRRGVRGASSYLVKVVSKGRVFFSSGRSDTRRRQKPEAANSSCCRDRPKRIESELTASMERHRTLWTPMSTVQNGASIGRCMAGARKGVFPISAVSHISPLRAEQRNRRAHPDSTRVETDTYDRQQRTE
jgi:hypothetical protein